MYNCNKMLLRTLSILLFAQIVAQMVVTGPLVAQMIRQYISYHSYYALNYPTSIQAAASILRLCARES